MFLGICVLLFLLCFFMFFCLSPMLIALSLVFFSFFLSILLYKMFSMIFPSAGVVLSFSSGMMILFLYCSMFTKHEKGEGGLSFKILFFLFLFPFLHFPGIFFSMIMCKEIFFISFSPFLLFSMLIVLLAMLGVNKGLYSPFKVFYVSP